MFITQIFKGNETHCAIFSEKYFVVSNNFYLKKKLSTAQRLLGWVVINQ